MADRTDVAIVGGGPAGAALAIHLARRGIHATVAERQSEPAWRACGVFSSPLTRARLVVLGFAAADVDRLARPIKALRLETVGGIQCRLEYPQGFALGFSRPALDAALLDLARQTGADVRMGTVCHSVELSRGPSTDGSLTLSPTRPNTGSGRAALRARVVVGADGGGLVAATAGVSRRPLLRRAGITFHRQDHAAAPSGTAMDGRFLFGPGWYVGLAPVTDGLVNVGMVVPAHQLAEGPEALAARLLGEFSQPRPSWITGSATDGVRVQGTLGRRAARVAGEGWLLVGDSAGFIDPLTGEGLQRALITAELAARSIEGWLKGDRAAFTDYDRRVRSRFRANNVISWILQSFLARPAALEYALRRLARRDSSRQTLTLALTGQVPASRALDPRFLARLLAP